MEEPITEMLSAAKSGDPGALDELFGLIYGELRKLARSQRRRWSGNEAVIAVHPCSGRFLKATAAKERGRRHWRVVLIAGRRMSEEDTV